MEFISNLIKRPKSLVINETSPTTDKLAVVSASLPNSPSASDTIQSDSNNEKHNQLLHNNNNNNRPLSMSSSYNGGNITDFIGVPDEFLAELEEFLPPPPPLTQSPFQMSDNRSLSLTPPPPPPPPLTPSMKTSLTIDELLLEIHDNLQQAGLHDDVLAIASPHNAEISPLSSKSSLNNSKKLTPTSNTSSSSATNTQIHTPNLQTVTSAAGTAATVFEANSSIHKFHIDPELETGIFDDHQQQLLNNSGVNKSSNKFVGLTEFDEAKIPELPGDLNPNIEEQYCVTFEKCFIPTLSTKGTKDEFVVNKTHLLLPKETDTAVSSDNETFADCQDEDRDPLATTFAGAASTLDTTTDLESYQSANNNTLNVEHNNTMDNIADITMESEVLEAQVNQQNENLDEDEPMDIDMNATMEIIQSSTNNIQHVEKVLQHAENILQHIEEKKPLKENEPDLRLEKQSCEKSSMNLVVNSPKESIHNRTTQHLEIEQSKHELSLNKSIELPVNERKTISSECIIEAVSNEIKEQVNEKIPNSLSEIENVPNAINMSKSLNQNNLTIDCMMNSSIHSNSSSKSPIKNLNLTTSLTSQNSSAPSSPLFPLKPKQNLGFPRSPIAEKNNPQQMPFLEKSDYLENSQKSLKQSECDLPLVVDNVNENCIESNKLPEDNNNLNGTFVEPQTSTVSVEKATDSQMDKTQTFTDDTLMRKDIAKNQELDQQDKLQTNSKDTQILSTQEDALNDKALENLNISNENHRRTFAINSSEDKCQEAPEIQIPSTPENTLNDKALENLNISNENHRRTFAINSSEDKDQEAPEIKIPSTQEDSLNENKTLENLNVSNENHRRTFAVNSSEDKDQDAPEIRSPTQIDSSNDNKTLENLNISNENRRCTFNVQATDSIDASNGPAASLEQLEKSQNTNQELESTCMKSRRTFNVALENTGTDNDFEAMDIDETELQNNVMPLASNGLSTATMSAIQKRTQSTPLPTMQQKYESSTSQEIPKSPPLPTLQQRSESPTLANMQKTSQSKPRTLHKPIAIKAEPISPIPDSISSTSFNTQNPFPIIQKRPSIHEHAIRVRDDILSLKEQSNIKGQDEKDVYVEKCTPSPIEEIFTAVSATSTTLTNSSGFSELDQTSSSTSLFNNGEQHQQQQQQQFDYEEFQGNNNLIFNPSDFDYLLTKGNNNTPVARSSLLLKFDPLLGVPVPVNQGQQQQIQQLQQLQIPTNTINSCLSPTFEEDEHNYSNRSFVIETKPTGLQGAAEASAKLLKERSQEVKQQLQLGQQQLQYQNKRQLSQEGNKKNATMSVDVIKDMSLDNDCNKTFENSNSTQSDDKQIHYKMDELEKKIKNEVLKTEDIEKKLKDAEQREEALIKRITEKDKTVSKMNGVIEAYEKAIAELIAEKEQLIQNYEKQLAEVKADRDSNYHHLTSLETTFSDLHVKYEKSKEMTCQLKSNEDSLVTENRKTLENLRLQEQRYDKMKNHAMQQLEIANKKLESLTRDHAIESTKLKALLKKEEIARSSINEQLTQKTKENAELVKICDELISGQGS